MVVARQILLIFNLSYLPCFVQFVNKNYCQTKNDIFTTCWCHYFVCEWCIVSLEEVLMNTPSGLKPSVVLTSKVRWARSEMVVFGKPLGTFTRKTYTYEVNIFRKRNSRRFIRYHFFFYSSFSTAAKIESKNTFIFTVNLHPDSLNAPYSIWYHWKDEFSLFKTVYRLIWKQVLVRVPVQVETP